MSGAIRAQILSSTDDIDKWAAGEFSFAIELAHNTGTKLYDLIGTTWSGFYLLSARVQTELTRNNMTGWRPCPINFKDHKQEPISGYSAIGITGKCGPLDNSRSKTATRLLPKTSSYEQVRYGLYFPEYTWSGDDFFRPEGTMLTIVTARLKQVIESMEASNIRFRALSSVERLAF